MAVKGFLSSESADDTQDCSVEELLEISKEQKNLYHAYKWVTIFLSLVYSVNYWGSEHSISMSMNCNCCHASCCIDA